MINNQRSPAFAILLFLIFTLGLVSSVQVQETWNGNFADGWRQFDQLTTDQKYEAASSLVEKMLRSARDQKNATEWPRCLIRYTQLRIALHGYEASVRFLKDQAWPEDLMGSSVLNLYYAQSLTTYGRTYSYEINRRERTDSRGLVDLKAWTRDQIYEEAQRAYENVWNNRSRLGDIPVTEWKEFITPNTYPARIRPSLRDAVSYLCVETLADTNGWQPDQLNELYRLNLKNLAAGEIGNLSLVAPGRHPLEKISFILTDLQNWHTQKGEREAALEAMIELYRQIHQRFTEPEDRKLIQHELENQLKSFTGLPWWAEGMAQLAEFIRMNNDPDSLGSARRVAMEGRERFPESVGGRHCLAVQKSIEVPDFSISGMQNDNPQKKSILVNHKNLKEVFFRAYAIDLLNTIETSKDYMLLPSGRDLEAIVGNSKPAEEWAISLPDTPDYRMHKTFVIPPMKKTGAYLVVASGRPGFAKNDNILRGIYLILGDLALITRQNAADAEIQVLSGSTGRPVQGTEVILFQADYQTHHRRIESKLSDAQGLVSFHIERFNSPYFFAARMGDQVALDNRLIYFQNQNQPNESQAVLFYTDRSIYRPTQKLFWKAIAYKARPSEAHLEISPARTLAVYLKDGNNQIVEQKTVTTNSYGTASGEFLIPQGRVLGQWHLESLNVSRTYFRVEEYKRPTFETKLLDPDEPLRLNQPARLQGEAKYYFGLPVTSGQVRWVVRRTCVLPWWWGFYSFDGNLNYNFYSSQVIAGGTASVKEDGTFSLTFSPIVNERLGKNKDVTYRYSVSADVTDEGGETRSAQRTFRLGYVSIEASAVLEKSFFLGSNPINVTIQRSSLDGVPRAGEGTWRIAALKEPARTLLPAEQPHFVPKEFSKNGFQTPGDKERERWRTAYNSEALLLQWVEGATRASGAVVHDEKGEGKIRVSKLSPGPYRLIYETVDEFGAKCEMQKNFIVAAPSMQLALPAMLLLENYRVKVGATARFLVHSGLKDQPMIFEIFRSGRRIRRTEMISGRDPSVVELPMTEADRGGLYISLSVLRDNQFIQIDSSLNVPWDNKELKVEFSTFRDYLRPGKQESWSVKVTGPEGKDTAVPGAELLAYMYDRSLDYFVPHSPVSPINLYPYRSGSVFTTCNLGESPAVYLGSMGFAVQSGMPVLYRDRLVFYSGYGIGGVGAGIGAGSGSAMGSNISRDGISTNEMRNATGFNTPVNLNAELIGEFKQTIQPVDAELGRGSGQIQIVTRSGVNEPKEEQMASAAVEMRSEFSETAFWQPHLLTGPDGSVTFEFKVPDSVTSWNVWVHAITRDFKSGFVKREARSVKELMVRPYLPRFLREGDQAEIKVVVNNASEHELKGTLNFDIIDVATDQSVLSEFGLSKSDASGKPFTAAKSGGANLTFPIKTPSKVGQIAFKVTATSGDFSDGELRSIPILPGRMHLMQSRFITLKDPGSRVIRFDDLARNNDPTRINEQMVVTLDAQLFYSVLSALPYLVNYPYECTEQTLNRFVSTGILSSLYQQYPAIDRMAKEFSSRQTQFEQWDAADPNRKMALEETPWLEMAKGGDDKPSDLINVLDSRIARVQRETALAKLRQSQASIGGFPWFPGGPPSPYMTLYLLHGFSKALEFGVPVHLEMVKPAWNYMHRHYLDDIVKEMVEKDIGWEFVTFINYVLSNYPDDSWYKDSFTAAERQTMLNFSYKHWRDQSPYLKGYLALTLKRMGRPKDAMLVWESVMDSAKTAEDQGTFWAPEDRGWLWYNDTIETHAFAIRTDMELIPNDSKLDGMVLWLFLNKQMNHWKSTRATAEAIYSLAHYLKKSGQLGLREDATVTIGNQKTSFVFEPDQYTGKKNRIVIPGEKINPHTTSSVMDEKTVKGNLFASATWHFSTEQLPEDERGDYLKLSRSYFKRVNNGKEFILQPLQEGATLVPGDEVEVHLSLTSKHPMEYVHLRDPRAAGFEPVSNISKHKWDLGISWYEEIRDSGTNFFFEHLPQGEYTFKYRIRAATAGTFKVAPATAQPMYAPEFAAYSTGAVIRVF